MSYNTLTYINQNIWWVIPTNKHYGILEDGQQVTSVHIFETFDNEQDWLDRLNQLDISVDM